MTDKENVRISKFLSLVLRHKPETIGITLDENGWTDVQLLIDQANKTGFQLTKEIVKHIVETNSKKRFALNESEDKIRASQGHSVEIDLGYIAQSPPKILYHGTFADVVDKILEEGLAKQQRHHVHLSENIATATDVGGRHGKPVVLEVNASQMALDGFEFYVSENGVWLTEKVPVEYLRKKK